MQKLLLQGSAVGLATCALLSAQAFVTPVNRVSPPAINDELVINVPVTNPVTFPDGSVAFSLDIDSNGRICPGGTITGAPDFSPTAAEFVAGPPTIAPAWADNVSGFVYVDEDAMTGNVLVTWVDVTEFGTPGLPWNMQVEIQPGGVYVFRYDSRMRAYGDAGAPNSSSDAIIGVSAGGGVTDPGITDIGIAAGPTPGAIYELFGLDIDGLGTVSICDLQSLELLVTPSAMGFSIVNTATLADPMNWIPGDVDFDGRLACITRPDMYFQNAFGSYVMIPGQILPYDGTFMAAGTTLSVSTIIGIGTPSTQSLPGGFSFTGPGGVAPDAVVDVDQNGRIFQTTTDGNDATPTVAELLGNPGWTIAPRWNRQTQRFGQPPFGNGGGTYYNDLFDPVAMSGTVSFTWYDSSEWFLDLATGFANSFVGIGNEFQLQLEHSTNSFQFSYQDIRYNAINDGPTPVGQAFDFVGPTSILTGFSEGNGAVDPGESDISADIVAGGITTAGNTYYEFFDNLTGNSTDPLIPPVFEGYDLDDQPNDATFLSVQRDPYLGGPFTITVNAAASATAAVAWFGFPTGLLVPESIGDLGVLNPGLAGCRILSDIFTPGATFFGPAGAPNTPLDVIPFIPVSPTLIGVSGLTTSALVIDPGAALALQPVDELITTIGL
jgi:hypothetical protein